MGQAIRRQQLKWTLVVFVLLAGVLYIGKIPYDQILRDEVRTRHMQLMKTADILIQEKLQNLVQDAHRLSLKNALIGYLDAPTMVRRSITQRALMDTANAYPRYAKIRYIDRSGMEQIRVERGDGGAYVAASAMLQDQSGTDYVQQGLGLAPGEMYLSPLDLDVEHGRIERPFEPTMRLVRRVANSRGEPRGILVLNYSAGELLDRLRALFPDLDRPMLLNDEGYWLLHPEEERSWGWLLGRPENTLKVQHPALWERIQATPEDMVQLDGDLFSHARLSLGGASEEALISHPRSPAVTGMASTERQAGDTAADRSVEPGHRILSPAPWVMLVQTRYPQWHVGAAYLRPWFRVFVVGLYVMAALLVYFVISAREQRRAARRAERRQLAEFKDLYDNAPIGYVTLAASGMITNVNQALLSCLGYTREELVSGYYFSQLVSTGSRQRLDELLHSLGEGEQMQCRLEMRCKNDEPVMVLCSVSSLISEANTLMVGRCSVQDITQQVMLEKFLQRLAYSDPLTGLANRRHFDELASREVQRLRREGGPLAALALDIDHFKRVNDTYGHDAGDEVLKALAEQCQKRLRGSDILARFGGEEFAVLLPGAGTEEGRAKAEELRRALAAAPVTLASGDVVHYRVSIGVAVMEQPDEDGLPALLKRADNALYEAKQSGRNRVCVAAP